MTRSKNVLMLQPALLTVNSVTHSIAGFRGGPHIPPSSRDSSSSQPQGGQGLALGSARGAGPHRPG